jgi:hypothetical protein
LSDTIAAVFIREEGDRSRALSGEGSRIDIADLKDSGVCSGRRIEMRIDERSCTYITGSAIAEEEEVKIHPSGSDVGDSENSSQWSKSSERHDTERT